MNKYEKYLKERKINRVLLMLLIVLIISLMSIEIYRIFFSDNYYSKVLNYVSVPVANKDLNQRDLIKSTDIEFIKLPAAFINDDVILEKDILIGSYVKLGNNINSYSLISVNQLENKKLMNDYGNTLLNKGQSLFSINTNLSQTTGNSLNPSTLVDIYFTLEVEGEYISDLLVSNVRIITIKDSDGVDISSENFNSIPYIIVMAINEEYIPLLNVALRIGDFDLIVNNNSYSENEESYLNKDSKVLTFIQ